MGHTEPATTGQKPDRSKTTVGAVGLMPRRKPAMLVREGFDGRQTYERPRPNTIGQKSSQTVRGRPGTFEWRYGRAKSGTPLAVMYEAGRAYADIWERAGLDGPTGVDWGKAPSARYSGMPDARLVAMQEATAMTKALGHDPTNRLTLYVVEGKTSAEVAKLYRMDERGMSWVLQSDLQAVGRYFGYE